MDDDLDEWQRLLLDQHGVVTRRQLLARGFTDHGIQAQLDAGRWQRLHDGVYVTYCGPLTPEARRVGALLACPGGAVLSHESAGEVHGFVTPDHDRPVHVTVRYGCSAVRLDGGWNEVTRHACRTAREVARLLRPLGWDGDLLSCPFCL